MTSAVGPGRTSGAGDGGPALPRVLSDWPAAAREEYEERVAILIDARMVPSRAEAAAEDIVRQRWAGGVPRPYQPAPLPHPSTTT